MRFGKLRVYTAGALALLLGIPLAQPAQAQTEADVINAALNLAVAVAQSAGVS